jgi:hypothetical protein
MENRKLLPWIIGGGVALMLGTFALVVTVTGVVVAVHLMHKSAAQEANDALLEYAPPVSDPYFPTQPVYDPYAPPPPIDPWSGGGFDDPSTSSNDYLDYYDAKMRQIQQEQAEWNRYTTENPPGGLGNPYQD